MKDSGLGSFKGVGPKTEKVLSRHGLSCVQDLIYRFPTSYEDRRTEGDLFHAEEGDSLVVVGKILDARVYFSRSPFGGRGRYFQVNVDARGKRVHLRWFQFHEKSYKARFQAGDWVIACGRVFKKSNVLLFSHPETEVFKTEPKLSDPKLISNSGLGLGKIVPIYSKIPGIGQKTYRKLVEQALEIGLEGIEEGLSRRVIEKYNLYLRRQAVEVLHFPDRWLAQGNPINLALEEARRRIVFEEFFLYQLKVHFSRKSRSHYQAYPVVKSEESRRRCERIIDGLSFELTSDQKTVMSDLGEDLSKQTPMARLLQGDVGSGKTIVFFLSCIQVVSSGAQVALLAPTEVLARQHYESAKKILSPVGITPGLLVGSSKAKERREISKKIQEGDIDLLVGTHAIFQKDVFFKNLAYVCIDEQHRFGVNQRFLLWEKGKGKDRMPHQLVMSATPIPRTLSMTIYGDLDVSLLKSKPKGRIEIKTKIATENLRNKVIELVLRELRKGRQVYWIFPLIEKSDKSDLKDAETFYEKLKKDSFKEFSMGLLHGRVKEEDKLNAMRKFKSGETRLLVSTTVIEVGIDVPNANTIIIENAERFGLSQLHQLRGRVGRGEFPSYCVLMAGNQISPNSLERLEVLEKTNDGFEIAEMDLKIRGSGSIIGVEQSGLPGFQFANFEDHLDILKEANEAAKETLELDPGFQSEESLRLRAVFKLDDSKSSEWFSTA